MTEPKFTAGPWRWYGNTKHSFYLATTHSGRLHVMSFERKGMRDAQPLFRNESCILVPATEIPIFEVCREATDPKDERVYRHDIVGFRNPDAHLIAAAPELYTALEALLKHSHVADSDAEDKDEEDHLVERMARKALAKARGEDL